MNKVIGKNLQEVSLLVAEGKLEKSYQKVSEEFLKRLKPEFYTYACFCTYAVVNDMEYSQVKNLYNEYVYNKQYVSWDSIREYFLTGNTDLLKTTNNTAEI